MKACVLALFAAFSAHAEVVGIVQLSAGASLRLHSEPGICVGPARKAEYVPLHKPVIVGCWVLRPDDTITVAFLDGDAGVVPVAAVRKPEPM
jgi:hypothetical protein